MITNIFKYEIFCLIFLILFCMFVLDFFLVINEFLKVKYMNCWVKKG